MEAPDADALEPFIGPPLMDSFREFCGLDEEKGAQAVAYYRERYAVDGLFENEAYPGIVQMLIRLQQAGCHLAVASSKPEVFVKKILEHFGMLSCFEVVVGSGLDGSRVRKEEVLEEALRQLLGERVPAKETSAYAEGVVMVGDRKFDIQGAKAYGIASVGVAYGYAAEGELEEAGADRIVKTVQELEEALIK
jgi:phosphoglycolate phosphatase